jgi:hypothetical protein
MLAKWLIMFIGLSLAEVKLKEPGLKNKTPLFDFALAIYYVVLTIYSPFQKRKQWN